MLKTNYIGDYVEVGCWSTIEVNTAIICACMPNLRFLLLRTFPKIMGSTHNDSKNTQALSVDRSGKFGNTINRDRGGITWTKSYNVGYSQRLAGDSDIELMDPKVDPVKVKSFTQI